MKNGAIASSTEVRQRRADRFRRRRARRRPDRLPRALPRRRPDRVPPAGRCLPRAHAAVLLPVVLGPRPRRGPGAGPVPEADARQHSGTGPRGACRRSSTGSPPTCGSTTTGSSARARASSPTTRWCCRATRPRPRSTTPGRTWRRPQQLADGEERQALRRALERLTEPHRLVFELAVYQERPYGEISELLGIPVGTVKSRMHNAVTRAQADAGRCRRGRGCAARSGRRPPRGARYEAACPLDSVPPDGSNEPSTGSELGPLGPVELLLGQGPADERAALRARSGEDPLLMLELADTVALFAQCRELRTEPGPAYAVKLHTVMNRAARRRTPAPVLPLGRGLLWAAAAAGGHVRAVVDLRSARSPGAWAAAPVRGRHCPSAGARRRGPRAYLLTGRSGRALPCSATARMGHAAQICRGSACPSPTCSCCSERCSKP